VIKKDTLIALAALGIIVGSVVVFYHFERNRRRLDSAMRIAYLTPGGGTPRTIEALVSAIAIYEEQIERHLRDAVQTRAYWTILGRRLAEQGMHRDAVYAFEQAINFNSEDPALFFFLGESARIVALSALEFPGGPVSERDSYFRLAEAAFLRAIELDPTYGRPRFSLGFMYTFHLDRPRDAIPQMELFMQISPRDVMGMFVLARAYFMTEQFAPARELYERILSMTSDPSVRERAEAHLDLVRSFSL